jgi:hypothetical protein
VNTTSSETWNAVRFWGVKGVIRGRRARERKDVILGVG